MDSGGLCYGYPIGSPLEIGARSAPYGVYSECRVRSAHGFGDAPGIHIEPSLFPKDGLLNLPKNSCSFCVQRLIVQEAIKSSFDESIENLERMVGIHLSKRQAEKNVEHIKKRPKPENKRVWASLEHSFRIVVGEMFEEAKNKDPNKEKNWVALVDGDQKQIRYLLHESKKYGIKLTIICDFIHVLEYL